jgi:lambda family phage tail tape measure protein
LEVDGRSAEQQVAAVRKALEALTEVGLRVGPVMSGLTASLANAAKTANSAASGLNSARTALNGVGDAGKKAGGSIAGAAGSVSTMGSNAAAAEAKLAAARKALEALNQAGSKSTAALSAAGGSINTTGQNARNATTQVQGLERQVKSLAAQAAGLAGPLAAAFSVKAFYDAAEAYSTLTNRMKLVTGGAEELAAAQRAVFSIAQSSYQPLNATAELYQRIATNQSELNLTGKGVAGVVGTISKTLAISGASASAASAALVQLGQAFASGTLRGEELNSVMEQAPALAQAIAAGMGKTVGELRALGAAGLLTADAVVKALQAQEQAVEALFNKTSVTIGNSLTTAGNSFTQLVGRLDQASGASAAISSKVIALSKSMDALSADSESLSTTINVVGAAMSGVAAASAVLLVNRLGKVAYAYIATRSAAIADASATLNAANADAIKARSAAALAQQEMVLYRGTVLQTVAAGRYAEARLIAAAADDRARVAAAGLATAQRGLLAFMGGPGGIAVAAGAVAASMFLMRDSSDEATKSLIDQGLAVSESIDKFKTLSAEQQRLQKINWAEQQAKELEKASTALDDFAYKVETGISLGEFTGQFRSMIAEVKAGKIPLDNVTQWIDTNAKLTPEYRKALAELAATQQASSKNAADLGEKLSGLDSASKAAKASSDALNATQAQSGTQTKAQLAEWEKYIAKLTEARDLLGANERTEAAYNSTKMGLTATQRSQALIVAEQTDLLKKYQDAVKEGDKVQQEALKKQLLALYTQEQAAKDATDAVKKSHAEAAKAAEESATKQIREMRRVIEVAANISKGSSFLTGRNMLLAPQQAPAGGLMGGTPSKAGVRPALTPQQRLDAALAQINESTTVNKSSGKTQGSQEDAGQKLLDDARQRYAVLMQQSKELVAQDGTIRTMGAEQKKLVDLEAQIAQLKEKKTLTAAQKQILAMADLNLAQQKQNAQLERDTELRKKATEEAQKLAAFQTNLQSQLAKDQTGLSNNLAGLGMGEQQRARLQEQLSIQQQYQSQMDNLLQQRNEGRISPELYAKETAALQSALQTRLTMQTQYYADVDKAQSDWRIGASSAMQTYLEQARDVSGQTQQLFTNAFSSMEDGIINFVRTGKLSFKDLADGIIADLIRIQVRQAAVGFLGSAIGAFAGFGGGGSGLAAGSAAAKSSSLGASAAGYSSQYGFSDGGYTGNGGKYQPMGVVHGGEFVVKKEVVSQPGAREFLERMNANRKGYADGGYVSSAVSKVSTVSAATRATPAANMPAIHQSFTFEGGTDDATLSRIQQAAEKGARDGYNMVLRDLKTNGPARQLIRRG